MASVNYTTNYVGGNILKVIHRHFPINHPVGNSAQILTGGGNGTAYPGAKTVIFKIDCDISPE